MHLEHKRICTSNSEVEVGKIYLYTEGKLECKVELIHTLPQKEGLQLGLKVVAKPRHSPLAVGEEFEVFASWTDKDTRKWWYLHDPDLAHFQEDNPH